MFLQYILLYLYSTLCTVQYVTPILSLYPQTYEAPSFPENLELPGKLQVCTVLSTPGDASSSPNTEGPSDFTMSPCSQYECACDR